MEKINAYLSKYQIRYVLAKLGVFLCKCAGFYTFICILGLCHEGEKVGTNMGSIFIAIVGAACLLALLSEIGERLTKYKRKCVRRYKYGLSVKAAYEAAQGN